ncbi:MAG TPA: glycosyltransferase [Caulobacteraceae bacterium]|nr:glycosyltransferase [Caulobacteraceae bacterium]
MPASAPGRSETRAGQFHGQVALFGRAAPGLWLFRGELSRAWNERSAPEITVRFENGVLEGAQTLAFEAAASPAQGVQFLLGVEGDGAELGEFVALEFKFWFNAAAAGPTEDARRRDGRRLTRALFPFTIEQVAEQQGRGHREEGETEGDAGAAVGGEVNGHGYLRGANGWLLLASLEAGRFSSGLTQARLFFGDVSIAGKAIWVLHDSPPEHPEAEGAVIYVCDPAGAARGALTGVELMIASRPYALGLADGGPISERALVREALSRTEDEDDFELTALLREILAEQGNASQSGVAGEVDGFADYVIEGWAVREATGEPCLIEVTDASGETVLASGRSGTGDADLPSGSAGPRFRIPLDGPARDVAMVRVFADGVELAGSPVDVAQASPREEFLTIDEGVVRGSFGPRSRRRLPPKVSFRDQEGAFLGEVQASAGAEPGCFVFEFTLPANCHGRRELIVRAFVGEDEIARNVCDLHLEGRLETLTAERCSGWLASPNAPGARRVLEVWRDGKVIGTGACTRPRADLKERFPDSWEAGFDFELKEPVGPAAAAQVSIRLEGSDAELFDGPFLVGARAGFTLAAQRALAKALGETEGLSHEEQSALRAAVAGYCEERRKAPDFSRVPAALPAPTSVAGPPRLNVIIPIYKDVALTKRCIVSVLRSRNPERDRVVLVNDCSPDEGMAGMLAEFEDEENLYLLNNAENLGFVKSVNRAIAFCGAGDVLLLNSDTEMFAGGLDELYAVAHAGANIGTVTALSNNATVFSYPHPELQSPVLADISWRGVAAAALKGNRGLAVDAPTGNGFCLLIRRDVLDRLGPLNEAYGRGYGEENELCCKASDLGYRHVAAAGAFVQHHESVSFGSDREGLTRANLARLHETWPEFTAVIMDFEAREGLRRGRWAIDRHRLSRAAKAGVSFAAVVGNGLDGGTRVAMEGIEEAVGYGGRRKLGITYAENDQILLEAEDPLIRAVFSLSECAELFELLEAARVTLVVVHQLLGFPADFIERLGAFAEGRRSAVFVHDFYTICPRVTLIDASGKFCGGADEAVCARCIDMDGPHEASALEALDPGQHRALFRRFLGEVGEVVAPSRDAAERLAAFNPGRRIRTIPHPETWSPPAQGLATGRFENVILIGALGLHKGAGALLEIARQARLTHPELRFRVIGFTDRDEELLSVGNITITGRYQPEELGELIAAADGKLALFLSGWPETFSYALSEAVAHGLVPLAPDIGAPAERIREAGFGHVFPFPIEADEVLAVIDGFATGRIRAGGSPQAFFRRDTADELREVLLGGAPGADARMALQTADASANDSALDPAPDRPGRRQAR